MVHTSLLMHWCTESTGWTRGLVPALLSFPLLTQGSDGWDHAPLWAPFPPSEAENNTSPVFTDALQRPPQTRDARTALLALLVGQGILATLTKAGRDLALTGLPGSWDRAQPCCVFPRILSAGLGHAGVSFSENRGCSRWKGPFSFLSLP